MKQKLFTILAVCILLVMSFPLVAQGADYSGKVRKANYVAARVGLFSPSADLNDMELEDGYDAELAYGYYFNDNLVLEVGSGIISADGELGGVSRDLMIFPVTVTAKAILPLQAGEVYLGAGPGIYFARLKQKTGTTSSTSNDTVLGGHIVVGANVDVSDNAFIGAEAKWILTDDAKFFGNEIKISGATFTGHFGYRF